MSERKVKVRFEEEAIDSIFRPLDQNRLPGAAVGIALGGKTIYRKGFGLANMELPVVLTPNIRMRIYSTTKHFTCLVYMLLCEEGRADMDEPIGRHLPDLHPVTQNATARQLMGNNSGLRDACEIRWLFSGTDRGIPSEDLLSLYKDIDDANCAPGTTWCYNNGGYQLLSAVIERIEGRPLEDVFRARVFEPAGMCDSMLRRCDTDFVPNSASMHTKGITGHYQRTYLPGALAGEGGIVSSIDDMLRWLSHMDHPIVGSEATWSQLKTPQILRNGVSSGYGLGLVRSRYRGIETLSHSGGGLGASSQMLKVPSAGLDVIVMMNRPDVSSVDLVNRILDACLPDLLPVDEPTELAIGDGVFGCASTGRVIQLSAAPPNHPRIKEGRPMVAVNGLDIPVQPDNRGVLRPVGSLEHLKLEFVPQGDPRRPASIVFSDFGNLTQLTRLSSENEPAPEEIGGRYRSDTTQTEVAIVNTPEGLRLHSTGRFGAAHYKLEALAQGVYRCRSTDLFPWGGVLLFDRDGGGFRFSSYQTWALRFRRLK
jgi:D-aminopeptidase